MDHLCCGYAGLDYLNYTLACLKVKVVSLFVHHLNNLKFKLWIIQGTP